MLSGGAIGVLDVVACARAVRARWERRLTRAAPASQFTVKCIVHDEECMRTSSQADQSFRATGRGSSHHQTASRQVRQGSVGSGFRRRLMA